MTDIVKVCVNCGPLTKNQVREVKQKRGIYLDCLQCEMDSQRKTYLKYREERLERAKKYREANREKLAQWARDDRARNKAKYQLIHKIGSKGRSYSKRLHYILNERGLTKEQYDAMITKQNNKCAICLQPETRKDPKNDCVCRLCIDHCHETGRTRELLCHSCNTMLGKAKENISILKRGIAYLRKHSKLKP